MNEFRELKRHIEFFSGRAIHVYRCSEDKQNGGDGYWIAKYTLADGQMVATGDVYDKADEAIDEVRRLVILEVERENLYFRINQFIAQLESESYSREVILKALGEFSDPNSNGYKITPLLEAAKQTQEPMEELF